MHIYLWSVVQRMFRISVHLELEAATFTTSSSKRTDIRWFPVSWVQMWLRNVPSSACMSVCEMISFHTHFSCTLEVFSCMKTPLTYMKSVCEMKSSHIHSYKHWKARSSVTFGLTILEINEYQFVSNSKWWMWPLRVQDELIFWTFVAPQIIGIYAFISNISYYINTI